MTEEEIYKMAYNWALHVWNGWNYTLGKSPDNEIYQNREKEAWKEVKELELLVKKKEFLK